MDPYNFEAREQAQARAATIATQILAGERGLLEAAHELKGWLWRGGLPDDDPALRAFVLIDSETDALPLGTERQHWEPAALAQKDQEIARAEMWARPFGVEACEDVVRRFGHLTSR
jgi:hypothetical protein